MGSLVWKVLGTGSAVVAGVIADKMISTVWKTAGQGDHVDPEDPNTPWKQALGMAALTGIAVGVSKAMTTRQAAAYYQKSTGHLPKAMEPAKDKKKSKQA